MDNILRKFYSNGVNDDGQFASIYSLGGGGQMNTKAVEKNHSTIMQGNSNPNPNVIPNVSPEVIIYSI
jgi:hypothetical protein